MPYIFPQRRYDLLSEDHPVTSGELNFVLTTAIQNYLNRKVGQKPRYEDYNAAIGALECCKLELYRRLIVPYEQGKILENGDVYE